VRAGKE